MDIVYIANVLAKRAERAHNIKQMHKREQGGFIPMLICLVLLIVAVLYLSYHYVAGAQH